jgi:hypothetical protein
MERLLRQGRLRKLQPGMVAPAIFDLPRACAEMLKEDLTGNLSGSSLPVRALGERIVLTSSDLNQIQATTIRQYLNQTWPSDGTPILRVLQSGLPGPESPRGRQTGGSGVQDDIETHVRFSNAGLLVQLDGLAHLVIERAEQVAWLSGATQPSADPITRLFSLLSLETSSCRASPRRYKSNCSFVAATASLGLGNPPEIGATHHLGLPHSTPPR